MEPGLLWPRPTGGEAEAAPSATGSSSLGEVVDLGGRGLEQVPEHVLGRTGLEYLYLEGNAISELSEDFFHRLPNLIWLDLRNNKLTSLPLSIGDHRCLKTLLLEGNPIQKLPVELGNVTSLKALNLRKCPIEFPPDGVLHQGLAAILAFLKKPRAIEAEHTAESACDTGIATTLQQEAQIIYDEYRRKVDRGIRPRKSVSKVWSKMIVSKMPVIEKLQLNTQTESSLDFSNEKERQEFKILKQKLAQEERREGFLQSRKDRAAGFMSTVPSTLRKEDSNPNTIFPASKAYDVSIQAKRKEELKLAALKELKEKQAYIEQRKLDHKVLKNWRDKAKLMQEKKEKERMQRSPHLSEKNMIVKNAPFATDPNYYYTVRVIDAKRTPVHKNNQNVDSEKEMEELRAARDRDLQLRIQQHIELMQARRKQPKGTPQEELEAAKRELEVAVNLKSELARRKIIANPLESNFNAVAENIPYSIPPITSS